MAFLPIYAVYDGPVKVINDIPLVRTESREFSFVVFGDFRTSRRDKPYHETLLKILDEIEMIHPDLHLRHRDGASFKWSNQDYC